jgi:hypothetical protein
MSNADADATTEIFEEDSIVSEPSQAVHAAVDVPEAPGLTGPTEGLPKDHDGGTKALDDVSDAGSVDSNLYKALPGQCWRCCRYVCICEVDSDDDDADDAAGHAQRGNMTEERLQNEMLTALSFGMRRFGHRQKRFCDYADPAHANRCRTGINSFSIKIKGVHFHKGHLLTCNSQKHARRIGKLFFNSGFEGDASGCKCCAGTCGVNPDYLPTEDELATDYPDRTSFASTSSQGVEIDDNFSQSDMLEDVIEEEVNPATVQHATQSSSSQQMPSDADEWLATTIQFQQYLSQLND